MSDERSNLERTSEKPKATFLGKLFAVWARTFAECLAGIAIWGIVGFLIGGMVGWFLHGVPGAVLISMVGATIGGGAFILWKSPWTEF